MLFEERVVQREQVEVPGQRVVATWYVPSLRCRCRRARVMCLHFVAPALSRAARAVAGADGIYGQPWCIFAETITSRSTAALQPSERRAALEPPEIPRNAIIIIVPLRRHAVLPYKKVVVVGELVHETDFENRVAR